MTNKQEKRLEAILSPKPEVFIVTLDGSEMYVGTDKDKALHTANVITATLSKKQITGTVQMVGDGDQHIRPFYSTRVENRVIILQDI